MREELLRLGLTNNEITVYLALLETGLSPAGKIIHKTNLHSHIVYSNLERLVEKGLVRYVIISNVKNFETTDPEELLRIVKDKEAEISKSEVMIKSIIPKIELKKKKVVSDTVATVYEGKRSLKNVLDLVTKSKTEILIFASGWGGREVLDTYYDQWHLKLKKNKIKGRAILSSKKRVLEKLPYKLRYVVDLPVQPITLIVYDDNVLQIIWQGKSLGILIKNKKVTESYRSYFEVLWKRSRKITNSKQD